jgi:hypothetical protein
VKLLPRDKEELEQYLKVIDDFVQRYQYKTLSTLTLCRLADGGITWAWKMIVKEELLILSNVLGILFY